MSLTFLLSGAALLVWFPRAAERLWRLDSLMVVLALVFAALSLQARQGGWARGTAVLSWMFASLFLVRMCGEHLRMRDLYRLHAVSGRACEEVAARGAAVDPDAALARALELADLPREDERFFHLTCSPDGPRTSMVDDFDASWTLDARGELGP
ncbi:hypothetical protein LZ198_32915 [Myxococcus sp. K15C18031901]|uniref:hypothetical protein n=1 Tax=Myxococcus dinghuensis TaxID=2906761 RepID=UPI0020A74E99|nr:hypothetical protein [Myxococcus dinghuensis]MCP3103695.1 hypothetical protein [Myxococcus dinghuensis]